MTAKLIALAIGMNGTFYGAGQAEPLQGEITHIWSEACVNLKLVDGYEPTSVFVPPQGTPATGIPSGGYYFLPDAFVEATSAEPATFGTEGIVAANPDRPLSFGERAVGLQFNPSNQTAVYQCKTRYAALIDQLEARRQSTTDGEVKRLCSIAITEAQTAQMWAVKALTWES
jgi:hypothetical protein